MRQRKRSTVAPPRCRSSPPQPHCSPPSSSSSQPPSSTQRRPRRRRCSNRGGGGRPCVHLSRKRERCTIDTAEGAMLLVIDAGNTNVVFAVHDDTARDAGGWRGTWRLRTDAQRTSDE